LLVPAFFPSPRCVVRARLLFLRETRLLHVDRGSSFPPPRSFWRGGLPRAFFFFSLATLSSLRRDPGLLSRLLESWETADLSFRFAPAGFSFLARLCFLVCSIITAGPGHRRCGLNVTYFPGRFDAGKPMRERFAGFSRPFP